MSDKKDYSPEEIAALQKELDALAEWYNFGFEPVETQVEFIQACLDPAFKEVVLVAGRGWGKDLTTGMYLYTLCKMNPGIRVLFICPFFRQVKNFFNQVMIASNDETGQRFIPQGPPWDMQWEIVGQEIRFKPDPSQPAGALGSTIVGISADNPENIRSFRGNVIVLNEAADIPQSVITTHIYPCIKASKKDGFDPKMVYIGTPKGKNFLFKKFVEGLHNPNETTKKHFDPAVLKPTSISFQRTFKDNPKSSMDLELNKSTMSHTQFMQEIMAEFVDDSEVFRNLQDAFFPIDLDPGMGFVNQWGVPPVKDGKNGNNSLDGHRYVAGLDLAREKDWSVLTIIDVNTGKIAYFERFQGLDYFTQARKVLDKCQEYNNALLMFDNTGVGTAISDILFNENKNPDQAIIGKTFTTESKPDMIQRLAVRIQRDKEWIASVPVLQSELQALKVKRSDTGRPKYEAPTGQHDDCVMSLAMANLLYMEEKESMNMTITVV